MSPEEGNGNEAEQRARRLRFRIAFFLTSLVALSVVVTLPFSVKSVVDDILGPVTGRVVKITRDRPDAAHPNHTKLHMAFVSIDETQLLASIRVSGHHVCVACDWSDRLLFVSVTIVIIFTLGAITVRALIYVHDEGGMGLFRRRRS